VAELAFDEARHEYRLDGVPLPSVTQVLGILQDFGGVPAEVLARAAEFGRHVHLAVDLYNKRMLDEASLDPALAPYLADWHSFLRDAAANVLKSECRLVDPKLGFAGTLDTVVLIRGKRVLVDVKTGQVPRTVGPQLAAYKHLYESTTHNRIHRRLCVQLTGEGYRVHEQNNPADWSVFLSALNCWRFINAG
jgi:hypothetical protein